jgi:H+/Cl- antiporter ClcA
MNIIERSKKFFSPGSLSGRNEVIRKNILNALPFWIAALVSGAVAVFYAKLFSFAEHGTAWLFHQNKFLLLVATPVCFLLAWLVVQRYAPFARGSGIPQVIAAIELTNPKHNYKVNSLLSIRIIITKIISSLLMVFGGGIVGREGPTIQISASIFKWINDLLPTWYPKISRRNMLVTGAASGLAAAFNTPLGGIVFAIEELTKTHFSFFRSALLTGVIIAGLTALYFLGPYLYLGYPQLHNFSNWMILIVIPLAIITGFLGSFMGNVIIALMKKKSLIKKTSMTILYILLSGLVIAAMAVLFGEHTLGSGKEIMVQTLFTSDKKIEWYLPILRMLGSIISFGTGGAGGVFAPSLSAGASIGAVYADLYKLTDPEINLVILCGMTGFLTSITRSPFTSSILILEMTNSHNVIFFIMLTALAANLVATVVSRHSFYDRLKDQYIRDIHLTETQQPPEKDE